MRVTKISSAVAALMTATGVGAVYHASREGFENHQVMRSKGNAGAGSSASGTISDFDSGVAQLQDLFAGNVGSFDDLQDGSVKIFGGIECATCQTMSSLTRTFLKTFEPVIVEAGDFICKHGIEYLGYKAECCPGIVRNQFAESILPAITDHLLNEEVACTFILNICDTDKWKAVDLDQWIEDLLKDKPEGVQNNDFVNQQYLAMPKKDKGDLIKLALISDLHMDWDYTPGMNSVCQMPVCCRSSSGLPATPDNAAGKWGDYNCDIPPRTLQSLLDHISHEVKPDAVFWGGDSIPHNLESLHEDSSVAILKNTTQMVADGLKGYSIFAAMGNHDTYPQDQIRVGGEGFEQAIKEWAPSWAQFMDNAEATGTWLQYGYYSKQLTNNTRVIALNSNICYNANFEAWTSFNDSGNQFGWLINQLQEIEQLNGYAIILAHVPNLDECTRQYARRYHAITDRYQHIIRFGMFSHIHSELYQVMGDIKEGKSIGMNFIVGSATTYKGKPPSFDLLYLDPETMLPVDLEVWAFDLEQANKNDKAEWKLYMDYRKEYGLADLSPASFYNLSQRIQTDKAVCQQYKVNSAVGGPKVNNDLCSSDEQLDHFCQTTASDSDEQFACKDSKASYVKKYLDGEKILMALVNGINYQWYEEVPKETDTPQEHPIF